MVEKDENTFDVSDKMTLLEPLKEYARLNKVPIIVDDSLAYICKLIIDNKYQSMLEIGSAIGYSALSFSKVAPNLKIVTIEKNEERYLVATNFLKQYDCCQQISLLHGDALLIDFKQMNSFFDIIFIDAAKSKNQALFERFVPLLSSDGVIITDNINFHGLAANDMTLSKNVRKMLMKIEQFKEYVNNLPGYQTVFVAVGDGLAVTRRRTPCS